MPIPEFHEVDLQLISEASKALNKYLDSVDKDECFEIKKDRWICLRKALSSMGKISPELKETFMKSHNLLQYKSIIKGVT